MFGGFHKWQTLLICPRSTLEPLQHGIRIYYALAARFLGLVAFEMVFIQLFSRLLYTCGGILEVAVQKRSCCRVGSLSLSFHLRFHGLSGSFTACRDGDKAPDDRTVRSILAETLVFSGT